MRKWIFVLAVAVLTGCGPEDGGTPATSPSESPSPGGTPVAEGDFACGPGKADIQGIGRPAETTGDVTWELDVTWTDPGSDPVGLSVDAKAGATVIDEVAVNVAAGDDGSHALTVTAESATDNVNLTVTCPADGALTIDAVYRGGA